MPRKIGSDYKTGKEWATQYTPDPMTSTDVLSWQMQGPHQANQGHNNNATHMRLAYLRLAISTGLTKPEHIPRARRTLENLRQQL